MEKESKDNKENSDYNNDDEIDNDENKEENNDENKEENNDENKDLKDKLDYEILLEDFSYFDLSFKLIVIGDTGKKFLYNLKI